MLPISKINGRLFLRSFSSTARRMTAVGESEGKRTTFKESVLPPEWRKMDKKFPEFLPTIESKYRNPLREKLERSDMLKRRNVVSIPEFYVGSIMAVEVSDRYALNKESRFVGLCIHREGQGLRANFTLRNIVDGHGIEIRYDIYNPSIRSVEVLKLEKRIDNDLRYLRDALPEYSTVPFDMLPVPHDESAEVPVNEILVKMKPRPWTRLWERDDYQGIEELVVPEYLYNKYRDGRLGYHSNMKYDIMEQYRKHIPEDEQYDIWKEVSKYQDKVSDMMRTARRKRLIQEQFKKKFV